MHEPRFSSLFFIRTAIPTVVVHSMHSRTTKHDRAVPEAWNNIHTVPYPTLPYPILPTLLYTAIPHPTSPYPTLPYPTLPYPTLPYPTLSTILYTAIPYPTLPYPTLPYPPLPTLLYPAIPYPTLPYPVLLYLGTSACSHLLPPTISSRRNAELLWLWQIGCMCVTSTDNTYVKQM